MISNKPVLDLLFGLLVFLTLTAQVCVPSGEEPIPVSSPVTTAQPSSEGEKEAQGNGDKKIEEQQAPTGQQNGTTNLGATTPANGTKTTPSAVTATGATPVTTQTPPVVSTPPSGSPNALETLDKKIDELLALVKGWVTGKGSTPVATASTGSNGSTGTIVTPGAGQGSAAGAGTTTANFNPVKSYEQSCGPEKNPLGGCIWDVGAMGDHSDLLNRDVVEVGIVKGVEIKWSKGGKVANSSSNGRCSLVVLNPNSWFEDLTVKDANVTLYKVSRADIPGWSKTLAVQAAYEQQQNYGCPAKSYPQDIEHWGSTIASPPCGTPGFSNCPGTQGQKTTPGQTAPQTQQGQQAPASPTCETVNCKDRRASADHGGSVNFSAGEAVYGFRITIGGKAYNNCYLANAPGDGTVVDGVVNYWPAEVKQARACS